MTRDTLKEALCLDAEIEHLKHFVQYCRNCWKILRIQRYKHIKLETSYGCLQDSMTLSGELADRILDTIEGYIADKEKEMEDL